jgi:hypothetical protein
VKLKPGGDAKYFLLIARKHMTWASGLPGNLKSHFFHKANSLVPGGHFNEMFK